MSRIARCTICDVPLPCPTPEACAALKPAALRRANKEARARRHAAEVEARSTVGRWIPSKIPGAMERSELARQRALRGRRARG